MEKAIKKTFARYKTWIPWGISLVGVLLFPCTQIGGVEIIRDDTDEMGVPMVNGSADLQARETYWDLTGYPPPERGFVLPEKEGDSHPIISFNSGDNPSQGEECCGLFKSDLCQYTMTLEKARDFVLSRTLSLVKVLELQKSLFQKFEKEHPRPKGAADFHLNPFFDPTVAARDALSSCLNHTFEAFYSALKRKIEEAKKVIKDSAALPESSWRPLFKGIKKFTPLKTYPMDAQARAIAQYTLDSLEPVLKSLEDFLKEHSLGGTKHPLGYIPPQGDPSRIYWKNGQGQWCSGYGSLFEKTSNSRKKRKYPLFLTKPITPGGDYSAVNVDNRRDYSRMDSIPASFFTPLKAWRISQGMNSDTKNKKPHRTLKDLTLHTARDLIFKIQSLLPGYLQAKHNFKEHWWNGFAQEEGEFSSADQLYHEALCGYKRQLTLLIMRVFGPFYDAVQENLRCAEAVIAQEKGLEEKLWKPLVEKWSEEEALPLKDLLNQSTSEKKLAAAYYLVKMLKPIEEKLDNFLDNHIYLRGSIYLFYFEFGYDQLSEYYAYQWNNAHGYPCYGFGRLLSPRKPRPPIPLGSQRWMDLTD